MDEGTPLVTQRKSSPSVLSQALSFFSWWSRRFLLRGFWHPSSYTGEKQKSRGLKYGGAISMLASSVVFQALLSFLAVVQAISTL